VHATSATDLPLVTAQPPRSFDEFFRTEHPRLLRVLSAADASAADALQEAFAKAAAAWSRVSQYEQPAAWVRRVAVHQMLNERRSARRRDAAFERLGAVSGTNEIDREALLDLAVAIDALPKQQRIALTLFYLGGLKTVETAEAMGLSAGTVRFHLHEARDALREILGARDE
jgi:RNA polymerase sigma-70 factor, ECF subfamily